MNQKYKLSKQPSDCPLDNYDVVVTKELSMEYFIREKRKPLGFVVSFTKNGEILLRFTFFTEEELDALKQLNLTVNAVISTQEGL